MAFLCCPTETPFQLEARLSKKQLKSDPIHIWWHRRRILSPASSPSAIIDDSAADRSPFPDSWSINYSGSGTTGGTSQTLEAVMQDLHAASTDDSSVFSTVSQDQRMKRDAFGNCLKHPHIQLARRRQMPSGTHSKHQVKSRFSRMFSKHHHNSSTGDINKNSQGEKWEILRATCPECENEQVEKSKARYHYKPYKPADTNHQQLNSASNPTMTHVPFPATLTLINAHPHLAEGTLALRVRTDPVPTDQTMHLSCAGAATGWKWSTPEGALDFLLPADSNGEILDATNDSKGKQRSSSHLVTPKSNNARSPSYQIMERIIPISSIDHVSRGGDAWDILRQSTGLNDHGCKCDVKIHGFSDRLLRFDVINFDAQSNDGDDRALRHSFGWVDFAQSPVSSNEKDDHAEIHTKNETAQNGSHFDSYTAENVISKINSIVLGERVARKTGVSFWISSLNRRVEEYLSLGAPKVNDPSVENPTIRGKRNSTDRPGIFDQNSRYTI